MGASASMSQKTGQKLDGYAATCWSTEDPKARTKAQRSNLRRAYGRKDAGSSADAPRGKPIHYDRESVTFSDKDEEPNFVDAQTDEEMTYSEQFVGPDSEPQPRERDAGTSSSWSAYAKEEAE